MSVWGTGASAVQVQSLTPHLLWFDTEGQKVPLLQSFGLFKWTTTTDLYHPSVVSYKSLDNLHLWYSVSLGWREMWNVKYNEGGHENPWLGLLMRVTYVFLQKMSQKSYKSSDNYNVLIVQWQIWRQIPWDSQIPSEKNSF